MLTYGNLTFLRLCCLIFFPNVETSADILEDKHSGAVGSDVRFSYTLATFDFKRDTNSGLASEAGVFAEELQPHLHSPRNTTGNLLHLDGT